MVSAVLAQSAEGPPAEASAVSAEVVSKPSTPKAAVKKTAVVKMGQAGIIAELHIHDTDIRRALEMLNAQARKNIITTKDVTGKVTADLYRVTFREAIDAILRANNFVYTEKGNFIYVMTAEQAEKMAKAQRKTVVRMFRLSYIPAADAKALVADLLSSSGSIQTTQASKIDIKTDNTSTGSGDYAFADMLVIKDYEENVRRIAKVISEVDVRPQQVLIEATILKASLGEENSLGIDFSVLDGIDLSALSKAGSMTISNDFSSAVDAGGTGGLTVNLLLNKLSFFIRALETITDVTVMANPKLLVVNKQRGEVLVGNSDGYVTTTTVDGVATQTVEFLDTGTRLIVRPFIGRDNYVRLEIHPEDSSGTIELQGTNSVPHKQTTEITSNVLVRDGHTIVIGGLFRESADVSRSQVPAVGNIPYLGAVFRSTSDTVGREEVIILITPRIINHDVDEAISEQLKDQVERFCIGQRKGLRWWGRNRIAQSHMRFARRALAKGKRGWAMWNIDAALSMLPRMEEAIRLKEQLTGRAYWADEAQVSTAKYIIQQMIMNELGKPLTPVIYPKKPRDGKDLDEDVKQKMGISGLIEAPLPPLAKKETKKPDKSAEQEKADPDELVIPEWEKSKPVEKKETKPNEVELEKVGPDETKKPQPEENEKANPDKEEPATGEIANRPTYRQWFDCN